MKKRYHEYINKDYKFDKKTLVAITCLVIVISGTFGWLYEFIFYFFNSGMQHFYWRGGNFLPWINIYAIGAIMICLLTYKSRKNPFKVFISSCIVCGVLEYISGFGMLYFAGKRCWDYNQEIWNFGNINGFVCLRSVMFFGLSALFLIYVILPLCFYLAKKINKKTFLTISIVIFSIVMFDELYNLVFARILNTPRAYDVYHKIGFNYVKFK